MDHCCRVLTNVVQTSDEGEHPKIAVVDGMVILQKLNIKAATVKTVRDLSVCYNEGLMDITRDYDEVIVVFDTYKYDSLKSKTMERRQKEKSTVQYQVKDGTKIHHITLQTFLSHEETKAQLAEYLAEKNNRLQSKLRQTCHYIGSREDQKQSGLGTAK